MGDAQEADFRRASDAVGRLITGLSPQQWDAPTPCSEWNVRQLVEHLVGGNHGFAARLTGTDAPAGLADGDPLDAYRSSVQALATALGATAAPEGHVRLRMADLITHGWDLARATQRTAGLPEDLTEQALEYVTRHRHALARSGMFADPCPVRDDAPALERLAALAGREVG